MQNTINGGIYRVHFNGTSNSEFRGDHPTVVIRTLKEDEIYLVVPLTSYTKEKMEKARKKGFGYRINSTNSIARIDKIQIVNKTNIKNRWMENQITLRITKEELIDLTSKVNDYINLSGEKATKEYSKYIDQYEKTLSEFKDLYERKQKSDNMFKIVETEGNITISCLKKDVHWLSVKDMLDITKQFYTSSNITSKVEYSNVIININN